MPQFTLNKKTFLVPTVPTELGSLQEVLVSLNQFQMFMSNIIQSIQPLSPSDLSWLKSSFTVSDDKYMY